MAGSQLKRLKSSLREQGIIGPQKSKKQRKQAAEDGKARNDKRLQRGVVLDNIREQFNPFDLKHAARGPKFDVTTNKPQTGKASVVGRPGQSRMTGEERRKQTLLLEMQRRNKVGGILDKRFGENDPTMAPEDKMLERFAAEKQRAHKKGGNVFDLENDDDDDDGGFGGLTHGGKALHFGDDEAMEDFDEDDLGNESDASERDQARLKRVRAMADAGITDDEEAKEPERKKTKKEVMEEVIAKSKMHKYERQQAKEEDDDLRAELDKELPNIAMLLSTKKARPQESDPSVQIAGVDRSAFERNFDVEIKKLAQDKRAAPQNRIKTDEEKAEEQAEKLQELEDKRQRRMRGEEVTDSEESEPEKEEKEKKETPFDPFAEEEDVDDFGLGGGIKARPTATSLGLDDEDDFFIEDDLVASGSEPEELDSDMEYEELDESEDEEEALAEDDEFIKDLLDKEEAKNPIFGEDTAEAKTAKHKSDTEGLPFTFPCPASSDEFKKVVKPYPTSSIPTIVQRIRALYHPKLDANNKERLGNFATALIDFLASPWDPETSPEFAVLENITRHIHSLAKMFPLEIANRFRFHLKEMSDSKALSLEPSDMIVLTAAGSIFPTSDHFHAVVTPAMLTMGRYLGQKVPQKLSEYATGSYLAILCLQYQDFSKRYTPEVLNFTLNTILALAPTAPKKVPGYFPVHTAPEGSRISGASKTKLRTLSFEDCIKQDLSDKKETILKVAILNTSVQIIDAAADLWTGKEAYPATFAQAVSVLKQLGTTSNKTALPAALTTHTERTLAKLARTTRMSTLSRRPLELHHHRPLAIKTHVPRFEDNFDPDKHYDPDKDRADMAKLKKEHKRERKGAMRELRRDANFMAREKLKVKKAKDEAYEKKYKRLVAEIQSEEGREANNYERESKARKRHNDKQKEKR